MKVDYERFIQTGIATAVIAGLLGLAHFETAIAQEPLYTVTLYNPVEANIAYRLKSGELQDRYCGNPPVDGYMALYEGLVGRKLGSTIGEIGYIKGNNKDNFQQVFKLCIIDVVAAHDYKNGKRPSDQIADIDPTTYSRLLSNTDISFSFKDPRSTVTKTIYTDEHHELPVAKQEDECEPGEVDEQGRFSLECHAAVPEGFDFKFDQGVTYP